MKRFFAAALIVAAVLSSGCVAIPPTPVFVPAADQHPKPKTP